MPRLPTLFVSHGSPMLALNSGPTGGAWRSLAARLPRPRAIVVASAHHSAPAALVSEAAQHPTVHDFGGFPAALYQIRYETAGAPELARQLVEGLIGAGMPARLDPQGGLDHGAWVPLRELYPQADVPIVPISIDARQGPAYHYRLGQALGALLPADVLLLASGSLTHNLYEWRPGERQTPAAYVGEFQAWMYTRLQAGVVEDLLDYRRLAPSAARAHPTEEHLLPLFVALGAAGAAPQVRRHFDAITDAVLAMDVYEFAAA